MSRARLLTLLLWLLLLPSTSSCSNEERVPPVIDDAGGAADAQIATDATLSPDASTPNAAVACSERDHVLRGGGKTFGSCAGDCRFELELSSIVVLDTLQCKGYAATLTISDTGPNQMSNIVNAELTSAAWEESERIGKALEGQALQTVYGCPDCTDGGAAWVLSNDKSSSSERRTDFEYGNPPALLKEADAFVQELITQLVECKGAWIESCFRSPSVSKQR